MVNRSYYRLDSNSFPKQKVPYTEKSKPEWYARCCDFIIDRGISLRDTQSIEEKYAIMHGNIPLRHYEKVLNPYNAKKEEFKRFPATLRNYDIIKGIIRRYIGEYIKNYKVFTVTANNPEVVQLREARMRAELAKIVEAEIAAQINQLFNNHVEQGGDPKEFNPQTAIDVEEFTKKFNEEYIDDISSQAQDILDYIRDFTKDELVYARAYFNYVAFGECYTYSEILGDKIIKRCIDVIDAFPIPNDEQFVEDHDMFAHRRKMSYQQIIDEFDKYFDDKDREFLERYYAIGVSGTVADLSYSVYQSYYSDVCGKFPQSDREHFRQQHSFTRDINDGLYDVWHVVWKGWVRYAIVTYVNGAGLITVRVEDETYKLNPEIGDISIEYDYKPQVYESVRIGGWNDSIYPYKARPVIIDRDWKLPYNGVMEVFPGFGKFSVIDIVTPYQLFYNIVAYHREMVIAKNKLNILLMPKSLLGVDAENTLHKMLADGILFVNDSDDQGMLRSQQIRMVNATLSDYILQLGRLMEEIENSAKEQVDMTPQRYGEISSYAGKSTTEEAINRGSMGSVIIEYMMDTVRELDYNRDLDYAKVLYVDGLQAAYKAQDGENRYISLNVDNFLYGEYGVSVKNSFRERNKLEQVKQLAFSIGQNGDTLMAVEAIDAENVSKLKKLIKQFEESRQEQQANLQQVEEENKRLLQEYEITKIQVKGEEDRKSIELKGLIEQEIELIRADANMVSFDNDVDPALKEQAVARRERYAAEVDKERLRLEREKIAADNYNKEEDRKVKMKDIDSKLKIAKVNRNKHDSNSKAKK